METKVTNKTNQEFKIMLWEKAGTSKKIDLFLICSIEQAVAKALELKKTLEGSAVFVELMSEKGLIKLD